MSDRPKCNACGLEIHRDSSIAYMGTSVRHKHRSDCIRPLQARIAELERQLSEAREDTARMNWLDRDTRITADEASDASEMLNGHRWEGKVFDSLREAIDAARKETK